MKIVRRMNADKVRAYCIENELYTCGTSEEYQQMFQMCDEAQTDEQFIEIAKSIYEHSDVEWLNEQGTGIECVALGLLNRCVWTDVMVNDDEAR